MKNGILFLLLDFIALTKLLFLKIYLKKLKEFAAFKYTFLLYYPIQSLPCF